MVSSQQRILFVTVWESKEIFFSVLELQVEFNWEETLELPLCAKPQLGGELQVYWGVTQWIFVPFARKISGSQPEWPLVLNDSFFCCFRPWSFGEVWPHGLVFSLICMGMRGGGFSVQVPVRTKLALSMYPWATNLQIIIQSPGVPPLSHKRSSEPSCDPERDTAVKKRNISSAVRP